jgi:hypothetical protein
MVTRLLCARCVAVALAIGSLVAPALAGDRVTLSKPGKEEVAPQEADTVRLRRAPNEFRRENLQPPPDVSYIPPEVRVEPRKTVRKNIFGDPINPFSESRDGEEEKEEGSLYGKRSAEPKQLILPFTEAARKQEQDRALSPIRQFDWSPEDKGQKQGGPREQQPIWSRRDNDNVEPGMFGSLGLRRDSAREAGNGRLFGLFGAERENQESSRNELTRQELERRNEFQKLINPSFSPLARNGAGDVLGSPTDPARANAPIMPVTPMPSPRGGSLDPMQVYRDQQQSWRGPSMDDLNRRTFGAVAVPSPSPSQSRSTPTTAPKIPLMRQPAILDMPSRTF